MLKRHGTVVALLLALFVATPVAAQTSSSAARQSGGLETDEAMVFLRAFQMISQYHQSTPSDSSLWEHALEGVLEELNDPYATVFTPDQYGDFRESNTGDYAGIGVQITQLAGRVTITAVFRETPAERVGIQVGDQIVWVEGVDARDWSIDDARDAIRGEPGSLVDIRVDRSGYAQSIPMTLERDNVHVSAVATAWIGKVGHIVVDRVAKGSADELQEALEEFEGAEGIILDLRANPGGYLEESIEMADLFIDRGLILASQEGPSNTGGRRTDTFEARTPALVPEMPIVVLVDRFTASAAEILSGALQDYDRAIVVGERTFGKGIVQSIIPLPAERQLRITTGAWYTPLGRSLHRTRDRNGVLLPDDDVASSVVLTPAGRELNSDGGITPDIVVVNDTLKTSERALLTRGAEAEVSVAIQIEEHAFELAKKALAAEGDPQPASEAELAELVDKLIAAGLPAEVVNDPDARRYLEWRTQIRYLMRADARGAALGIQAQRDKVLAQALSLLAETDSRAELLARAVAQAAARPRGSELN